MIRPTLFLQLAKRLRLLYNFFHHMQRMSEFLIYHFKYSLMRLKINSAGKSCFAVLEEGLEV